MTRDEALEALLRVVDPGAMAQDEQARFTEALAAFEVATRLHALRSWGIEEDQWRFQAMSAKQSQEYQAAMVSELWRRRK